MTHRTDEIPGEYIVHPEPVGEWEPEGTAIVQINRAMQALEQAATIQDMVALRDKARALEVFVTAQGFRDAAQVAKVYQLKAERKAGAWLAENIDHEGGRPKQGHDGIVLDDIDISPKESSRWQLEASLPAERFDEWVSECLAHAWELSAGALRKIAENHAGKQQRVDSPFAWFVRRLQALRGLEDWGFIPAEDVPYIQGRLADIHYRLNEIAERAK